MKCILILTPLLKLNSMYDIAGQAGKNITVQSERNIVFIFFRLQKLLKFCVR